MLLSSSLLFDQQQCQYIYGADCEGGVGDGDDESDVESDDDEYDNGGGGGMVLRIMVLKMMRIKKISYHSGG